MEKGFLSWIEQVITGFAVAWRWLNTPLLTLGDFQPTPLLLLTFTGLTAFIIVALVKWGAS